jgi:ribosome-associated protein
MGVEEPIEGRGRSARKREAKAVEHLAQRLVDLPEAAIVKLHLTGELADELQLAKNTLGHSSRKRQIKHLAGFLRRHDTQREQLEAELEGFSLAQRRTTLVFHNLEQLRDRLCRTDDFETALEEIRQSYPRLDVNKLAGLARSFHAVQDKKAYREIFRRLRQADEESSDG